MLDPRVVWQYYKFLRELDFTSLFQKGKLKAQVCVNISRGARFIFFSGKYTAMGSAARKKKMFCSRKISYYFKDCNVQY